MINYDGRLFRAVDDDDRGGESPVARYRQDGDVIWAEFTGGRVRRGSIAGTCGPDGVLDFGYCMVLDDGEVITGRCQSRPSLLADGRIRLSERWERYSPEAATGISYLEEIPSENKESAHLGDEINRARREVAGLCHGNSMKCTWPCHLCAEIKDLQRVPRNDPANDDQQDPGQGTGLSRGQMRSDH